MNTPHDTSSLPPSGHLPEPYQLLTTQMAHDAGYPPVVTRAIRNDGRFRTYGFRSALRNIYILTENDVVVMVTSNRKFVELAYSIEPGA